MRHRMGIASSTGLGNPEKELLENKGRLTKSIKKCLDEAIKLYFKEWGGCDFDIYDGFIKFGVEPAYWKEKLKIIQIAKTKENSFIETGFAWGYYGSNIAKTRRYYGEYKNKSKFIKFVDKWHKQLYAKNKKTN